jgi:hypothetical protein
MAFSYGGSADAHSIPDITSIGSFTIFCRANRQGLSGNDGFFAADNYPSTPRDSFLMQWRGTPSATRFEVNVNNTGGVSDTTRPGTGEWHSFAIVRNGTTATPYYDASSITGITVGSGNTNFYNIRLGCHYYSGSNNEFVNGYVAEAAIWDVDLDQAEITALDSGCSPLLIRPANLQRYIPCLREEIELRSGATVTAIGSPSVIEHPNLIMPSNRFVGLSAAAAAPTGTTVIRLAGDGGLAGIGGLAGRSGGLAG